MAVEYSFAEQIIVHGTESNLYNRSHGITDGLIQSINLSVISHRSASAFNNESRMLNASQLQMASISRRGNRLLVSSIWSSSASSPRAASQRAYATCDISSN